MNGASAARNDQTANGFDVVCFANDWAADPLSKKQVMTRLGKRHRVLWVNSINNRRPRIARKDFRRVLQKLGDFGKGLRKEDSQIWVLSPIFIPFHGRPLVRGLNRRLLGWQIRRAMRHLKFERPVTWTFVPSSADVVGTLGERLIVYHCVDEYGAFSDAAPEIREREQELLAKSGLVVVCSSALLETKKQVNPQTHLVTHGVDYEHFRRAVDPQTPTAPELSGLPRPILGFHGLIADWVDLPLLAKLAQIRPQWSIVMVGRADTDTSVIQGVPNIQLLGHRPYAQLPQYLRGFDVALLPFVNNELTINANPLKLREYLAAGLPVVATPIPEVARLAPPVRLASTAEQYAEQIEALLAERQTGASPARSQAVATESWDEKVANLELLLKEALVQQDYGESDPMRLPSLKCMGLRLVAMRRGGHSELWEYRPTAGGDLGNILVKRLVRWKSGTDAEVRIRREGEALAWVGSLHERLRGTVPTPIEILPETKTLILRKIPGVPLSQVLKQQANCVTAPFYGRRVYRLGQKAGEWLRVFHDATRQASIRFEAPAFLATLEQRLELCQRWGANVKTLDQVRSSAESACEMVQGKVVATAARQGDYLPQNILVHQKQVAVVDFENFAEQDAVYEDLSTFLAYLLLLRASPLYSARVLKTMATDFVRGYGGVEEPTLLNLFLIKATVTILSEFLRKSGSETRTQRLSRMEQELLGLIAVTGAGTRQSGDVGQRSNEVPR
jgi:glycosyltransferase involved in cell wall biosynthesis